MEKDKKWFVDKWTKERNKTDVHDPMYHFINEFIADVNQLDELEALSQEWIDKNVVYVRGLGDIFEAVAVESLLVPKKELPVIPKYVAEYLEYAKKHGSLIKVMELASISGGGITMKKEYDWISENSETFARAWLDGYKVEEEPLYHALIKGHELVDSYDIYWNVDRSDCSVFVSSLHPFHDNIITEMSKEAWNELGINETNADLIEVDW